jgi:pimeloyl-ACP methyl ester carboxylesterase
MKIFKRIIIALGLIIILFSAVYFLFPGFVLNTSTKIARFSAGMARNEINVEKHNWVYLDGGKGDTVILIHGFGLSKDLWGDMLPAMSKSFRIIAPDLPCFGETIPVDGEHYTVIKQAERLHKFITALKLKSFHLVGTSIGGAIVAVYASQHPDKVKSVSLIGPFGVESKIKSDFQKAYDKGHNPLVFKTTEGFDETVLYGSYKPKPVPAHMKSFITAAVATRYDFNKKTFKDEIDSEGWDMLRNYLKKIESPVLVIFGDKDRIFDVSCIDIFKKGIRNVKTDIIKDAGHLTYLDKPDETVKSVKDFIEANKK